jgi:hypothetical protein
MQVTTCGAAFPGRHDPAGWKACPTYTDNLQEALSTKNFQRNSKMRPAKSGFLAVILMAVLFAGSASFADVNGPPNMCLMIPETQSGPYVGASGYQPGSCVT